MSGPWTPGPWTYSHSRSDECAAWWFQGPEVTDVPAHEADARLIAAAPEMAEGWAKVAKGEHLADDCYEQDGIYDYCACLPDFADVILSRIRGEA